MYRAENYLCPIVLLLHKRALVGVRADFDGSGHGGIGLIIGFVRCRHRSFPPAVQTLALDNGREILVADIQIHIAVDTVYTSLLRMLPDAVCAAVIGLIDPVRQPDRVPRLDIIGSMCGQGRSRAIQSDKIAGVLNLFEECSHDSGNLFLSEVGKIDFGVIGEPTGMNMAVAEKGLMVLDCVARGKSGHAARNEGVNAIYEALEDIGWFRTYQFPKVSEYLGPVKMSVTMISAGTQHNVVPDECRFVVDVRPNGMYSNQELLALIKEEVSCEVNERSTRIGSSHLPVSHPVVRRGLSLGLQPFGSPTTSNQALCSFPTLKIGPGDSSRSHGPDEYITLDEIATGVDLYVKLLDDLELN